MTRAYLAWWNGSVWRLLLDLGLAGLIMLGMADLAHSSRLGLLPYGWGTAVVVVAVPVALVFRRRFPGLSVTASIFGAALAGALIAVPVACYTVASQRGNRRPTWVITALLGVVVAVPWGIVPVFRDILIQATLVVALVGAPVLLGLWVAQRRQLVASLRERAEQAERERDLRAENAVAAERARIARELHDLVAHRISHIAVQAGALEVSARDAGEAESAAAIRLTGAAALEEMRELLGVLRRSEAEPADPSPTLDSLTLLIDDARANGQKINTHLPESFPDVSGVIGRAVYRLVQEGLTNAAKHAPGSPVDITLETGDTGLTVSVRNGLTPAAARVLPESGFGLVGMRERVELAGGALRAGPVKDGFEVSATFPAQF